MRLGNHHDDRARCLCVGCYCVRLRKRGRRTRWRRWWRPSCWWGCRCSPTSPPTSHSNATTGSLRSRGVSRSVVFSLNCFFVDVVVAATSSRWTRGGQQSAVSFAPTQHSAVSLCTTTAAVQHADKFEGFAPSGPTAILVRHPRDGKVAELLRGRQPWIAVGESVEPCCWWHKKRKVCSCRIPAPWGLLDHCTRNRSELWTGWRRRPSGSCQARQGREATGMDLRACFPMGQLSDPQTYVHGWSRGSSKTDCVELHARIWSLANFICLACV